MITLSGILSICGVLFMSDINSTSRAVWDGLINAGYNEYAAAGVMGNIQAESNFKCDNVQDNSGWEDEEYTTQVDSGVYSEYRFVHDSIGYGLAQWTYYTRKQRLYNLTVGSGFSISNESKQIELLIAELEEYGYSKEWDSIYEASTWILINYENPEVQDEAVKQKRYEYSLNWYNEYSGSTPEPPEPPSPISKLKKKNIIPLYVACGLFKKR